MENACGFDRQKEEAEKSGSWLGAETAGWGIMEVGRLGQVGLLKEGCKAMQSGKRKAEKGSKDASGTRLKTWPSCSKSASTSNNMKERRIHLFYFSLVSSDCVLCSGSDTITLISFFAL